MSEEQKNKELVFEDLIHIQYWNYIIEELKKLEYAEPAEFIYFDDLEEHCYNKLDYKKEVPYSFCFACEYDNQFEGDCKNCPFEEVISKDCLNDIYENITDNYFYICLDYINEQEFNLLKQECIEYAEQIRDWKIREDVLCRSQIENKEK